MRVLLIETMHGQRYRHHRAEYFPFILGLARRQGWEGRWWVIGVPPGYMHAGDRYVVDLPTTQSELLTKELESWRPDVVVFHDRPTEVIRGRLSEVAPQARIVDLTASLGPKSETLNPYCSTRFVLNLLTGAEYDQHRRRGEMLLDQDDSCFDRWFLGIDRLDFQEPSVRLAVEAACLYLRPVRLNRFYRDLDSEVARVHRGCTFCTKNLRDDGRSSGPRFRTPSIERALRQIEAHQRSLPESNGPFEYIFEETSFQRDLDGFFEQILVRGVKPSVFCTMTRVDVLLGMRDRLEELLPRLRDAGHCFRLVSIGAENFSQVENERFNKGISPEQIWECFELIRDLEARFPETFSCPDHGYFAGILFTPWTRPEDLRVNIEAARRLGTIWLRRMVSSRLQLWRDAPITELVRHDGLTVDQLGDLDDVVAICKVNPDQKEVAWRFADDRTARIHQLVIRLEPVHWNMMTFEEDDPLFLEIRRLRAQLPRVIAQDYIELALAIVDAVDALAPDAGPNDVFERVASQSHVA